MWVKIKYTVNIIWFLSDEGYISWIFLSRLHFTGLFFSAAELCVTTQLSAKLPLSLNQTQMIHQDLLSLSLFSPLSVYEALVPGQGNLSDSEKHSGKTLPPADQGDTSFTSPLCHASPPCMKLFLLFFTPPSMMTCTLFDLENSITCDLSHFHSSSSLICHILISGNCVFLCVTEKCSVLWFDLSDGSWSVCYIGVYIKPV